jgi:hypothetical protein
MYKDVLKILKINNPERTDFARPMSFTDAVLDRVGYTFFTHTLKLKDDEIALFLVFCENDSNSKKILKPESEFELMDFLFTKNREFKTITTFEK